VAAVKVLELGSYIAPAYAGMLLAEQRYQVEKWTLADPIHGLRHGERLWSWINAGKTIRREEARNIASLPPGSGIDIVIDNHRASTWARWDVDPAEQAARLNVTWVSLRADDDGLSFDVIAQARAWGNSGVLPFYIGDTAAGLWLAFKAIAAPRGHHVIRQATALAKLREGELTLPRPPGPSPWDEPGDYGWDPLSESATVRFRGSVYVEPARDDAWRAAHLRHVAGRYTI
jgi:hypothetical protein